MLEKSDELGRLIRSARLAKGIRQRDLAQYLGIHKSQLWRYETGMVVPHISTFRDICKRLKLDFDKYARLWVDAKLEMEDDNNV
jgi:transcriptional regulator with XRE-family HTH domain